MFNIAILLLLIIVPLGLVALASYVDDRKRERVLQAIAEVSDEFPKGVQVLDDTLYGVFGGRTFEIALKDPRLLWAHGYAASEDSVKGRFGALWRALGDSNGLYVPGQLRIGLSCDSPVSFGISKHSLSSQEFEAFCDPATRQIIQSLILDRNVKRVSLEAGQLEAIHVRYRDRQLEVANVRSILRDLETLTESLEQRFPPKSHLFG